VIPPSPALAAFLGPLLKQGLETARSVLLASGVDRQKLDTVMAGDPVINELHAFIGELRTIAGGRA
jgi:hypothetical protein